MTGDKKARKSFFDKDLRAFYSGEYRNRTGDLLIAKQVNVFSYKCLGLQKPLCDLDLL